jgi:sortase (surface protein transpeptidase)
LIRLLSLIVGVLLVGGCGTAAPAPLLSSGAATSSSTPTATVPAPTGVTVPAIGAHSTLIPLGLTPEGALEVPPVTSPMQAGWYAPGAEPGQVGPAVIAGHVDGVIDGVKGQPGIFHDLRRLTPGAEILVDRADGSTLRFVVDRVGTYDKAAFPTDRVYGNTAGPELRLITCGGAFDRTARSYVDNIVVYAVLAS